MARRRLILGGALAALALVAAACGSNDEAVIEDVVEAIPTTATTTQPSATSGSETPAPTATHDGGLTGAPVPALDRTAETFDEDRLDLEGGTFPPLVDPASIPASASLLDDDALVLGAEQNGEARAYPLSMLTFHHVANDVLGGEPYLVTF